MTRPSTRGRSVTLYFIYPPSILPADVIVPPHPMGVCVCVFDLLTSSTAPGELEEEMENPEMSDLPEKQKHQLRHRELFLSRQLESLPATHIRYAHTHTHTHINGAFPLPKRTRKVHFVFK